MLSVEDVLNLVEVEGLGYAVMYHTRAEEIEDPEIRERWAAAATALQELAAEIQQHDETFEM